MAQGAARVTALLDISGVRKAYGDFVALDDVTLSIAEDELVSIVGPNGAGKTTLVNVITGLLTPTAGVVRFKGEDIAGIRTVLSCEAWRTFWNAGMAIAANRPMMTTTIMISTSVKPLVDRVFILLFGLSHHLFLDMLYAQISGPGVGSPRGWTRR